MLQMSLPTQDPYKLLTLGSRLRELRDEGVLIIGSGFLTHGLPFLKEFRIDAAAPGWSVDFDAWAAEALSRGDVAELAAYKIEGAGHALRPPHGRALHPAVRHPRRGHRRRGARATRSSTATGWASRSGRCSSPEVAAGFTG